MAVIATLLVVLAPPLESVKRVAISIINDIITPDEEKLQAESTAEKSPHVLSLKQEQSSLPAETVASTGDQEQNQPGITDLPVAKEKETGHGKPLKTVEQTPGTTGAEGVEEVPTAAAKLPASNENLSFVKIEEPDKQNRARQQTIDHYSDNSLNPELDTTGSKIKSGISEQSSQREIGPKSRSTVLTAAVSSPPNRPEVPNYIAEADWNSLYTAEIEQPPARPTGATVASIGLTHQTEKQDVGSHTIKEELPSGKVVAETPGRVSALDPKDIGTFINNGPEDKIPIPEQKTIVPVQAPDLLPTVEKTPEPSPLETVTETAGVNRNESNQKPLAPKSGTFSTRDSRKQVVHWKRMGFEGVDKRGRGVRMELLMLSESYFWRFGGLSVIDNRGLPLKLSDHIASQSMRRILGNSKGVVCLGTASHEGRLKMEEYRAGQRAERLNHWMIETQPGVNAFYTLDLGQYQVQARSGTPAEEEFSSRNQRRIILINITFRSPEADLAEALKNGLSRSKLLPFQLQQFSRFSLKNRTSLI